ncbi:hypothetical protein [Alteromonas sp. a30]|uniref:hypothetical protein n=1 Tax=Alteromonas sp. a30 TaxID=2730917 RepID=UPI00227E0FF8|nr:hypothetical protein [Alteromonas sp. a30]MCY7294897.1 hypothetical protein [Alteromonas sp. a30]
MQSTGEITVYQNNTNDTWYLKLTSSKHNYTVQNEDDPNDNFSFRDGGWHAIKPNASYHGSDTCVPNYDNDRSYLLVSKDKVSCVRIYASKINGQNQIIYDDYATGNLMASQNVDKCEVWTSELIISDDADDKSIRLDVDVEKGAAVPYICQGLENQVQKYAVKIFEVCIA